MVKRKIIVNDIAGEKRIGVIEDDTFVEFFSVRADGNGSLGNIYAAAVRKVVPGMNSAFIEFGGERTGFIHGKDLKPDVSWEELQTGDDEDPLKDRSWRIEDHIREGQRILVQVVKEPIGQKGARLTTHIVFSGRYAVLMPTVSHVGVSRKITDRARRDALRALGAKVLSKGYGIILRTAAEQAELSRVEKEIDTLIKQHVNVLNRFKKEKGIKKLYNAHSQLVQLIQNTGDDELAEIVVDNDTDYDEAREYLDSFIPDKLDILKRYNLPYPVFEYYGIEQDIERSFKPKVWMKSGGFLIIEQTEALTVVDVNTGKYLGKESVESTVLKTNLEAVVEIAYQLRLRNVAGIIIVDFIDMRSNASRRKVIDALESALKADSARTTVYPFTRLGLVQITRKRTSESNAAQLTERCPYCSGSGLVLSRQTVAFNIMRELQKQVKLYGLTECVIEAHPDTIFVLKQQLHDYFSQLTKQLNVTVHTLSNKDFHREHFAVRSALSSEE